MSRGCLDWFEVEVQVTKGDCVERNLLVDAEKILTLIPRLFTSCVRVELSSGFLIDEQEVHSWEKRLFAILTLPPW